MELDGFRVLFGDGSLRLMDPKPSEHTGSYTCVFSLQHNTHTERSDVTIEPPPGENTPGGGLIIQILVVILETQVSRENSCCYTSPLMRAGGRSSAGQPSYWWIVGLVVAVLVGALVSMLVYLKVKGKHYKVSQ